MDEPDKDLSLGGKYSTAFVCQLNLFYDLQESFNITFNLKLSIPSPKSFSSGVFSFDENFHAISHQRFHCVTRKNVRLRFFLFIPPFCWTLLNCMGDNSMEKFHFILKYQIDLFLLLYDVWKMQQDLLKLSFGVKTTANTFEP